MIDVRIAFSAWGSVIALLSSYATSQWVLPLFSSSAERPLHSEVTLRKLPSLTVPIISNGQLQGYVIAKLAIELDSSKSISSEPFDAYVVDEAFRTIYSEAGINFQKLERADLQKVKADILKNLSERTRSGAAKDILFEEFNYVSRADIGK